MLDCEQVKSRFPWEPETLRLGDSHELKSRIKLERELRPCPKSGLDELVSCSQSLNVLRSYLAGRAERLALTRASAALGALWERRGRERGRER